MNANINENQKALFYKLFSTESFINMTLLIEYMMDLSRQMLVPIIKEEHILNSGYYEDTEGIMLTLTQLKQDLKSKRDKLEILTKKWEQDPNGNAIISNISALEKDIEDLEKLNFRKYNIFEWWLISDRVTDYLLTEGQTILRIGNLNYWGRRVTGQAIWMDEVFQHICKNLEKTL